MKSFKLSGKRGITVAGTRISSVIISLVIAGVLVIFAHTADMSKRIDREYIATNIAKSRMERVRSIMLVNGFSALTAADLDESNTRLGSDGAPDANGDYRRSTTVTTNFTGDPRLTRVRVVVEYIYRGEWKTNSSITMDTLFPDIT